MIVPPEINAVELEEKKKTKCSDYDNPVQNISAHNTLYIKSLFLMIQDLYLSIYEATFLKILSLGIQLQRSKIPP